MANFAQINDKSIVIQVIVADSVEWINENLDGNWIETAVDGSIKSNYAGIGYTYNAIDDAFISPLPVCGHDDIFLSSTKQWECSACATLVKELMK